MRRKDSFPHAGAPPSSRGYVSLLRCTTHDASARKWRCARSRRCRTGTAALRLLRTAFAFLFTALSLARGANLADAIPRESRQLVAVSTGSWTNARATLQRFARTEDDGAWRAVGRPMVALIGERGLAWGRGLHAIPADAGRIKREGDRCAPAGVFRITGAFGQLAPKEIGPLRIPYRQADEGWEAVDDPASRHYNRIVDRRKVAQPDWRSAERLRDYRLAIDIAHNPRCVRGAGSCIFIHEWTGRRTGTAGCTVLREADLLALVRWLDASAAPVLMQAPK
jgi:D-alanyl-D-alanine dipeptidase